MSNKGHLVMLVAAVLSTGIVGCEKKGPLEQAGEEVDEAVHTLKNGGKETTADKVDDKLDDAADKIKN
jgi:predicted small lipoprotein YifL